MFAASGRACTDSVHVTILCYHAVRDDWESPLAARVAEFELHCRTLASSRTVVDLAAAVRRLDRSWRLPAGLAAITFDDGFPDFAINAAPVLARYGLPATMFLVAGTLDATGQPVNWVHPAPPFELHTLTRDQVLELADAGVTFGSHSYRHLDLDTLDEQTCTDDLRASRELLEDLLGTAVPFLAYPRGRHSETARRAARAAGYSHAFALPETREEPGPFAIPRVGVFRGNGPRTLQIKLSRRYLPLRTGPVFPALRRVRDVSRLRR